MIINIFYNNNIDSYLATALLYFKLKNDENTINLINIDTLQLQSTTIEDSIIDPVITPNSGEIYYFIQLLFKPEIMRSIISVAAETYYIDNNKTRLDEFKLQQYSFTNYKIDEYLGISHLTQHLLDISVDKNVYIIQLVSDYFKNPIPNEHSVNLIFGLKSYEVDPLKSDIGNIDTISKTFLIPKLHIWDCLLNSIHSMAHLQQIIFAGQHIRQYLKNNAINNTLQNVDYIIYNLFDNQFKSQIIYGDVSIFDDFTNYINSDIHESLIVYKHNSEIQGFDIWVKFFKSIDLDKFINLYHVQNIGRDIYHYQTCDLNFILPTDCETDLNLKSYIKTFNFVDPNYPRSYTVLFVQCTDYIFDYAYSLLFNQDEYNFFGHYKYNFETQLYEVHIKSEYEQLELYNFEIKYNAKISEDRLELILYMDKPTFEKDVLPL